MSEQRYYEGVGRRKTASARVRLHTGGTGQIIVNDKPLEEYFPREGDSDKIVRPLHVAEMVSRFDITVHVEGGGISGQTGAVQLGMARAILKYDEGFKEVLRRGGFLTRDSREKERKKPGLKRARKAPTYTKR